MSKTKKREFLMVEKVECRKSLGNVFFLSTFNRQRAPVWKRNGCIVKRAQRVTQYYILCIVYARKVGGKWISVWRRIRRLPRRKHRCR